MPTLGTTTARVAVPRAPAFGNSGYYFIALFIGACLLAGQAAAATPVLVGDAQAGQAKAVVCGACHGVDGNSAAPTFPKLAGQNEKYLLKQFHLSMVLLMTTKSLQEKYRL